MKLNDNNDIINGYNKKEKKRMVQRLTHYTVDYLNILKNAGLVAEYFIKTEDENKILDCLTYNTKTISGNTLFICKGAHFKNEYVVEAKNKGAVLFVGEKNFGFDGSYIIVSNIRIAMPMLAAYHYEHPEQKLYKIGVTGTKGKSTTVYFIKSIIDEYAKTANKKACAILSSIDNYDGVSLNESHLTTPESTETYRHMNNAVSAGIEHLVMEASSQGLKYNRLDGITFDAAAFLNIGCDHISPIEHNSFEDYLKSKMHIFDICKTAFINRDMEHFDTLADYINGRVKTVTFGLTDENSHYYGYYVRQEKGLISFYVKSPKFNRQFAISMKGLFNVENALCAIAICSEMGISPSCIARGLLIAKVKGRMEYICSEDEKINVIVDYAHNRLSFEKLFSSVRAEFPDKNIVAVFGCPGYKAYDRRKELPEVAGMYCRHIYITEEDPGEEPMSIIAEQIASNIPEGCGYSIIDDRGEAIRDAILRFGTDSVIVITGKGDETRQKRMTEYVPCPTDGYFVNEAIKEFYNKSKKRKDI